MGLRLTTYLMALTLTLQNFMGCDSFRVRKNGFCRHKEMIPCEKELSSIWRSAENCYRKEYLCDGIADCSDGSDEKYCSNNYNYGKLGFSYRFVKGNCPDSHYLCQTGSITTEGNRFSTEKCFHKNQICDDKKHCKDGSDEMYCPYNETTGFNFLFQRYDCPPGHFRCKSFSSGRKCIKMEWICDDYTDCDDASDENLCPHIFENNSNHDSTTSPTSSNRSSNDSINSRFMTTKYPSNYVERYDSMSFSYLSKINFVISSVTAVILILLIYNLYHTIKIQNFHITKFHNSPDLSTIVE